MLYRCLSAVIVSWVLWGCGAAGTAAPLAQIDSLRQRSLAVLGAEIVTGVPDEVPSPPDLARARELRKKHLAILSGVFFGDQKVTKKLEDIRGGRGNRDLGTDLMELSAVNGCSVPPAARLG